jgi:hypothetical protein
MTPNRGNLFGVGKKKRGRDKTADHAARNQSIYLVKSITRSAVAERGHP